jgi:hypothetical protein
MVVLRLEPAPLDSKALRELLAAFRETHANGGALFARFQVRPTPLERLSEGEPWDKPEFFEALLGSATVRKALPELERAPRSPDLPRFDPGSSYTLDGEWAQALVAGGAYRRFPGTPRAAKTLAEKACHDLFGDRFEDIRVYRSWAPWAAWFHDVAWDVTWVGIDRRDRIVWLLCLTDTD